MSERLINDVESDGNFDVLADVLETLRFRGSIFFRSELAAPWGISLGPERLPRFHIAFSGECYVGANDVPAVMVNPREIVMLPKGGEHWIADEPGRELVSGSRAADACELSEPLFQHGEVTNRIMCGLVHFDQESPHPILSSLPEIVHFTDLAVDEPIWATVALIDAEIMRTNRHTGSIIDRLTEVFFLQLLNHYANANKNAAGFLVALRDRRVYRALTLIHEDPGFDWTLTSLGERVGMSRATLVRHFQDAVGVAPMTYISNWRLAKAYSQVKYTSIPLAQIADGVGFASARTLSKAFQRCYDCTPKELRSNPAHAPTL